MTIEKAREIRNQVRDMPLNKAVVIEGIICEIRENDHNIEKPYFKVWAGKGKMTETIVRRATLKTAKAKLVEYLFKIGDCRKEARA